MKPNLHVLLVVILALGASACGKKEESHGVAQQIRPETMSTTVALKQRQGPFDMILNQIIATAYAAMGVSIPDLSFGPSDVASLTNDGGCQAIDNVDGVSLAPLTMENGDPLNFVPQLPKGKKFLVIAKGYLDGSSVGSLSKAVNNGSYISIGKPTNGDGTSTCYYSGVAVTRNWSFSLDAGCTDAQIVTSAANGSVVIEITGDSNQQCTLTAQGEALNGTKTISSTFKAVADTAAPVIDRILFDTDALPLEQSVTVDFSNPKLPVTAFGQPAMRFEVVSSEIDAIGTLWKTSNLQSGTNTKVYDWVKDTRTQTVLLTARKVGTDVLTQTKFIMVPAVSE